MKALPLPFILAGLMASQPALAERADRDKPVHLEADRITVDDAKKVHILEGNVQLVRGTLVIRTDRLVVTQDEAGFQKGIATGGEGGLAHFRQKREGRDEYVDGVAERIEHDGKEEKTEFFLRAVVRSGLDEVRGQYVSYDGLTENYLVASGPGGAKSTGGAGGRKERVRAVIQPKNKGAAPVAPAAKPDPALKPAPALVD